MKILGEARGSTISCWNRGGVGSSVAAVCGRGYYCGLRVFSAVYVFARGRVRGAGGAGGVCQEDDFI